MTQVQLGRNGRSRLPWQRYRSLTLKQKRGLIGLLFISPWLIGFLLFKLLPILGSLAFSFTDFYMLHPEEARFVGLANYGRALGDPAVGYFLFATIGFALMTVPVQLLISLWLAVLLNSKRLYGKQVHRALVFLPSVIPGAAILFVWWGFMDPSTGWLNRLFLEPLGLPSNVGSFGSGWNLYQLIAALWSIGPGVLIMLGAIKGIPTDLYEAARVDGAGPLLRLLRITVPMISPAIFFSLVINLVSVFGGAVLLDRGSGFGGGGQSPFDGFIYRIMFDELQLGYAASLAWLIFLLMLIVTVFLFVSARYWVYYPERE